MDVDSSDDRFTPEARRERGIDKHGTSHSEDGADSRLGNPVLMGGADSRVFTFNIGFRKQTIDQAISKLGSIITPDNFSTED